MGPGRPSSRPATSATGSTSRRAWRGSPGTSVARRPSCGPSSESMGEGVLVDRPVGPDHARQRGCRDDPRRRDPGRRSRTSRIGCRSGRCPRPSRRRPRRTHAPDDGDGPRVDPARRRPLARDRHLPGGSRGRGGRGGPGVADRRPPRRHAGPRGRGRPRGVPRRPVARAADAGHDDLRLGQGPPAAGPPAGPGRDARRHRGRGGPPVPDRGGPARAHPGRGRDPRRGRAAAASSTSPDPVVASEARRWGGITFEIDIPADLPAVFGERTYVEQVLRNLVSNAGKYSPAGTVVTVEGDGHAGGGGSSACSTAGAGSTPARRSACSSSTTGPQDRRGRWTAPGSACTSAAAWSPPWAAASGRGRGPAAARSSGSACRAARRSSSPPPAWPDG